MKTLSQPVDTDYSHELMNTVLKEQAIKYLQDKLIKSMKADIEHIAGKAVAQWASIKFSRDQTLMGDMNINVAFINDVIKHHNIENPIKVNITRSSHE